ncbi:glutathione S-transferase family protein [Aestuariispira insulae]|uniref:Glutathione S-transferase n=1 Tax=Aestuariispira insulae TaxID=1461337 RepID=A0A3D9HPB7_9PROT|nr:glutathione S-transferase N-terminal domain-containing protein [Aestuariispira insulae]RED51255.1 glutathione S-transferase [Aestuariispira insulae]
MKLYYSPASPYARKCLAIAHETGLIERIEVISTNPFDDEAFRKTNPLGKVPALITGDGPALFDSPVICDYLDSLHTGRMMVPERGTERYRVLRQHAIAQGITDAALLLRQQWMRNQKLDTPLPDDWWHQRQFGTVYAGMDQLEQEVKQLGDTANLGTIAVACALEYWDFRFADHPWREARPKLAAWLEAFSQRPAMQATRPE